jgi:trans-aconitate methyltransferase
VDALRSGYDTVCDEYVTRFLHELDHKPFDRAQLDRFAEAVSAAGPVADVGCGPGHVSRYLHERGVDVVGIDLSPQMIARARELHPGIRFETGDMLALDVEDSAWAGIAAF